jgi:hypothetical protein
MPRGGKREGAGRKPGSLTQRTREIAESALADGVTPLEYLLGILRDEDQSQEVRTDAAKSAAPYCHARLQSVEAHGNLAETYEERLKRVADSG